MHHEGPVLGTGLGLRRRWREHRLPSVRPSFVRRREELRRTRVLGHELGVRDPVFDVNSKLESRQWAEQLGIPTAALLAHVETARDLPWGALTERFVVKPVHGSASRGVHLLGWVDGELTDLRHGVRTDPATVTADLVRLADLGTVSSELVVEALVEDPHHPGGAPVDWKISAFFGVVGVVEAKVVGPDGPRWRLFDESWSDLGRGYLDDNVVDPSLTPPLHAAALLDAARYVSAAVPRPFVRVDLYDGHDGPVFGEITPEPGGPRGFRADIDEHLGRCWEEAEARMLVRAARAGLLSPASAPLPESAVRLTRVDAAAHGRSEEAASVAPATV